MPRRTGSPPIGWAWQDLDVGSRTLNIRQRAVVVVGIGAGLFFFGSWATTRGQGGSGWVAYAPLSNTINASDLPGPGLHPWVRLLIWLALIAVWVVVGVVLLRSRSPRGSSGPVD
jgi:heme/copper-type cytochrome/quinol oxidase subunit 1